MKKVFALLTITVGLFCVGEICAMDKKQKLEEDDGIVFCETEEYLEADAGNTIVKYHKNDGRWRTTKLSSRYPFDLYLEEYFDGDFGFAKKIQKHFSEYFEGSTAEESSREFDKL